jgi:hypothetical protein
MTVTTASANKKVAFMSPLTPPTLERPTSTEDPLPQMKKLPSNHPGRSSTTSPASSWTDLSIGSGKLPVIGATTSPNLNKFFADYISIQEAIQEAIQSNTENCQTDGDYLKSPASWSDIAEDDLIANLGSRERTRQEVLYQIVSSEER